MNIEFSFYYKKKYDNVNNKQQSQPQKQLKWHKRNYLSLKNYVLISVIPNINKIQNKAKDFYNRNRTLFSLLIIFLTFLVIFVTFGPSLSSTTSNSTENYISIGINSDESDIHYFEDTEINEIEIESETDDWFTTDNSINIPAISEPAFMEDLSHVTYMRDSNDMYDDGSSEEQTEEENENNGIEDDIEEEIELDSIPDKNENNVRNFDTNDENDTRDMSHTLALRDIMNALKELNFKYDDLLSRTHSQSNMIEYSVTDSLTNYFDDKLQSFEFLVLEKQQSFMQQISNISTEECFMNESETILNINDIYQYINERIDSKV